MALQAFIDDYQRRARNVDVKFDISLQKSKAAAFHWDCVLNLCASLDEPEERSGQIFNKGILVQLRVPRRREPRPVRHKRTSFFGAVDDRTIEQA